MSDFLATQTQGAVFEIVLNRPDKRNAIHWPLLEAIGAAIDEAERAPGVRLVVFRGEGSGFSAGIDLAAFEGLGATYGENWPSRMLTITAAFQAILNKVERCALPTLALLHGYALGLGLELALACDMRFAAQGAKLALPETRLGIIPDVGGTTRLTRLIGPARAKELILTGRTLTDLEQAERWGLVNAVTAPDELRPRAEALAAELSLAAPLAVSHAKRVIDGGADIDRGLQLEAWAQSQLILTNDFSEGVQAAMAKRKAEWEGR